MAIDKFYLSLSEITSNIGIVWEPNRSLTSSHRQFVAGLSGTTKGLYKFDPSPGGKTHLST